MPDPIDFVVLPIVWSLGVALAIAALAWIPWIQRRNFGRLLPPLALSGGMIASFRQITGAIPAFPPTAAMGWIFYLVILAAIAAVLLLAFSPPRWVQLIVVLITSAVSFTIVFINPLRDPEAMATLVQLIVLSCLVGGWWWWVMESAAINLERITAPLALVILALAGGMLMMMSGSANYGRMGLSFAGAAGALLVLTPFYKSAAEGCASVVVPVLGSILLAGSYYSHSDHRWANLALIALAPLLMSIRQLIPAVRARSKSGLFVSLSLLLIPIIIACVITVPRFIRESESDMTGYGY